MNIYRILGVIALIWGGGIVGSYLLGFNYIRSDAAYATGQYFGIVIGVLLFLAGLYVVIKGGRKSSV